MRRPGLSDRGVGAAVVLVFVGALATGALVGGLLGLLGGLDLVGEPAHLAASASAAAYYDCPDGHTVGSVNRGDRVFLTGRDDTGDWVEIRSPASVDLRVWLPAGDALADSATTDLPVHSCLLAVNAITQPTTAITSTTLPVTTTTTTTEPAATTTSSTTTSSTTTSSTTTSSTTTTTVAAPTVGTVGASYDPIWEGYSDYDPDFCNSNPDQPILTTISAVVSAPAGVSTVVMQWSVGGVTGSVAMTLSGGEYRATLGPFDAVDPNVVPVDHSLPISVTVRVTDALGRTATAVRTVVLNDCTFL